MSVISLRGNLLFPYWEIMFPSVGILAHSTTTMERDYRLNEHESKFGEYLSPLSPFLHPRNRLDVNEIRGGVTEVTVKTGKCCVTKLKSEDPSWPPLFRGGIERGRIGGYRSKSLMEKTSSCFRR